jgi:cytoskeletal protein CcmA (bactofilin family)
MFGRNAKTEVESVVGITTRIQGDLSFEGGLRIDGQVSGSVSAAEGPESVLIISEHARIEGAVRCAHLIVNGYIAGPVYSSELLELQPKGHIVGDVFYRRLEMHGGAIISGQLSHQQGGEEVLLLVANRVAEA